MPPTHILRFPATGDKDHQYVLVQVSSGGSKRLDLKLLATEGDQPYLLKLRHDRLDVLRAEHSPCSADEWEEILTSLLLEQSFLEHIEISADIAATSSSIVLTIKKNIQGITQRLGALTLKTTKDEIDVVDWCSVAIEARDKLKEDLASSTRQIQDLDKAVTDLKSQLDELIAAKRSDENELFDKFQKLLNEKKKKIREQQRRLAHSHADDAGDLDDEKTESGGRASRAAKGSRARKRKAAQAAADEDAGTESDNGFDKMDVDTERPSRRYDQVSEDHETTDQEETASEADDDEPPQPASRHAKGKGTTSHATATATATKHDLRRPPPKRDLPFAAAKAPATTSAAAADNAKAGQSETESDDDEL